MFLNFITPTMGAMSAAEAVGADRWDGDVDGGKVNDDDDDGGDDSRSYQQHQGGCPFRRFVCTEIRVKALLEREPLGSSKQVRRWKVPT